LRRPGDGTKAPSAKTTIEGRLGDRNHHIHVNSAVIDADADNDVVVAKSEPDRWAGDPREGMSSCRF
jgi:hypothetical protein